MNLRNLLIIAAGVLLIFYSFSIISCMNSEKMNETANENPYDVLIASSVIDVKTTRIPFVIIGSGGEYIKSDLIFVKLYPELPPVSETFSRKRLVPKYYSITITEDHIHQDGQVHIHENELGVYVLDVDQLDYPGEWNLEVYVENYGQSGQNFEIQTTFVVNENAQFLPVGSRVPPMTNRILQDGYEIQELSTHPKPEPSMYQNTVENAISNNRPSVVVFSTPAYCQSKVCGPVLDIVMSVMDSYQPQIDFIHIEPFDLTSLLNSGDFLLSAPAKTWKLPSEPWIIVIGHDGKVVAKFEGIVGTMELIEVFDLILSSN
ncbi:MAG: hypothetical protein VYD72_02050 [Chloroflexota bacterium]|nr:hypothetical protein [Chloroflexota bacterium]